MSNTSTSWQGEENPSVKYDPLSIVIPNKKMEVKDESFECDKRVHYNDGKACKETDKIFTLLGEVKQEPGYHITEYFKQYQQDPLYINSDEAKKVKEEVLCIQDIAEEHAKQKLGDTKYYIDIVRHKIQYLDDTKDISSTREIHAILEHCSHTYVKLLH